MSYVLLSACGSETAEFCNGAAESAVMEAVLRRCAEYLRASGLRAELRPQNVPSHAVASIANREHASLLLLLRSSAAPVERVGELRGTDVCFHPAAKRARALSEQLREQLEMIVPDPEQLRLLPSPQLPDFRMARCPAVQLRLGYRDYPEDAVWMLQSTGAIAYCLAKAITAWYGVPCISPFAVRPAVVRAPSGSLALRLAPSKDGELCGTIPDGAEVTLLHPEGAWQYIEHENRCGFVVRQFIALG